MYDRGRSGQFLYFNLLGSTSGLPITGIASGLISGRRCLDGGALTVCSGPVIEDGGGMYHLNMYAEDLAGNNIGFVFSTSGGINVVATVITQQNVSGKLFEASGAFVFASLNSGQPTLTYSGQLSGQPLTLLSGRTWLASGGIASGTLYLASGRQNPSSGLVFLGSGSYVHTNAAYVEGNVWYNQASTNAATTYPYNGTAYNAVNSWANALTVMGQMPQPVRGVFSMNGSQVTLLSGLYGFRLDGDAWLFAPGGFGLASTVVTHGFVSGVVAASTSGTPPVFDTCPLGLVTLPPSVLIDCGVQETLTLNGSGGYTLINCFSEAQGATGAFIDLVSGTGIHSLKIRNWNGGLTLRNVTSGDVVTVDGNGALTIDPTCVGGTLRVRGNFMFTNSGQIQSLNEAARFGSGNVYLASGSLSGQQVDANAVVASGLSVIASLYSGQTVGVYSGQLSGQGVTTLSLAANSITASVLAANSIGSSQLALTAVQEIAGGVWQTVLTSNLVGVGPADALNDILGVLTSGGLSGNVYLASGQFTIPYSGSLSGQRVELFSGNTVSVLSGAFVTASLASGQFTIPYSGQMSGQQVTARTVSDKSGYTAGLISGADFIASGHSTVASLYSGQQTAPYSGSLSGQPLSATVASGLFVNASLNSGQQVLVYSGQLSGQPLTATVGSGLSVVASLYSGQTVNVYSGQLSGQQTTPASGAFVTASLASGQRALPYSGQLSGQFVTPQSGTTFLGSGQVSVEIPQASLTYDFSGAPDVSGVRCLLNAERKLINRWSLNAVSGYLRVYKEDDSTAAYDQAVTSTSGAQPITSLDT